MLGGTALGLGCEVGGVAPAPMRLYPPSPPREFCMSIAMRLLTPSMTMEEEGRALSTVWITADVLVCVK